MKAKSLILTSLFSLASMAAYAAPTLTVGTPADSYLGTPSSANPTLGGGSINFDSLTPGTTYNAPGSAQFGFATISSPEQLVVQPYSTQSGPNFLMDNSGNGTASLAIKLASSTTGIGIGIADFDPVSVTLQALNASGVGFGTAFSVTIDDSSANPNPGNGYFVVSDISSDIWGLQILQVSADPNYSGLAIDDVQTAPEPASIAMFAFGGLLVAGFKLRKRA